MRPLVLALIFSALIARAATAQQCVTTDRGSEDSGYSIDLIPDGWPSQLLGAFNEAMAMWSTTSCDASSTSFPVFRTGQALPGEVVVDVQYLDITSNPNLFNTCWLTDASFVKITIFANARL
jgi:hypothetical protein